MKHFNRTVTVLVFIFLYVPMIVLAVASFNEGLDIATSRASPSGSTRTFSAMRRF